MNANKKIVRAAGILILLQLIAAIISHSIILEPILYNSKDFLAAVTDNSTQVQVAALLDFIVGASWFGASVLLFAILKEYSEWIALWFVGSRLVEFCTLIIGGIILLVLVYTGQKYDPANMEESSNLISLGEVIRYSRGSTQNLSLLAYSIGSLLFFYLMFKTKLIPRFLSVLGFIGITGLLTDTVMSIFGYYTGDFMYFILMPMGLAEILLGIWLIVRGFNLSSLQVKHNTAET